MIGRLAPGANVEPMMPGFDISVSVMVAPCLERISRSPVTVTGANASSTTMSVPAGTGPSVEAGGVSAGSGSAITVGAADGGVADALAAFFLTAPEAAEDCAVEGFGFFGFAFLTTGLGVVTTTGGNSTTAGAGACWAINGDDVWETIKVHR